MILYAFLALSIVFLIHRLLLLIKGRTTSGVPPKTASTVNSSIKAVESRRIFTAKEVKRHTSADDLWLIIEGKVYDFTDYVGLHPGGDAILRNAGADSTDGFRGQQHPDRVWDMVRTNFLTLSRALERFLACWG